jgi:hypothetical protein
VARVLRSDGLYISQHKSPVSLQASLTWNSQASGDHPEVRGGYLIQHGYYDSRPVRPVTQKTHLREPGTQEFVHRWEEIIGGMCRSGFWIEDLVEPFHADPDAEYSTLAHRCAYIAPYMRIKARRRGSSPSLFLPRTP